MANHYPGVTEMLERMGLPCALPEPEVTEAAVNRAGTWALAAVIADAINRREPLLAAESNGAEVTVREKGDGGRVFKVTVDAVARG